MQKNIKMFKSISKYRSISISIFSLAIFSIPVFAYGAGLVPCTNDCKFNDIILLVNNIVKFLMFEVALPLSAVLFSWAGLLMLTAGGSEPQIKKAKDIFLFVAIGLVLTFASWLIIDTITVALLAPGYSLLSQ